MGKLVILLTLFALSAFSQVTQIPGPSGGSGASSVSQLTDCKIARTSSTIATISACSARSGMTVYSLVESTATISAGTGTAYIYVANDGTLTVAHNVTLTCSAGCTATAGSSFPDGSIPLGTFTATSGTWDVSGLTDKRAMLTNQTIVSGGGGVTVTPTSSGYSITGPSTDYWSVSLAALDDGGTAKPSEGVYLGIGHNVVASAWSYGSNENAVVIPTINLANAGVGYFHWARRIPWALTSLTVAFGITEINGAGGDVYLKVQTFCTLFDNSTAGDTISYNTTTAQVITMPAFKKSKMVTFSDAGFSTGCSANSMLNIVVYRDPTQGSDTYAQDLPVSGMLLTLGH